MHTPAEISLSVDQNTVPHALDWLEAVGQQRGWPARTLFKLRLCLDETLTNITMHGYSGATPVAEQPSIRLQLQQHGRQLVLGIMDNGVAFDPTKKTPRNLDVSLDDAQIGGHGLRLMLHYLEDIRYEHRDGWNRLELVAAIDE